MIAERRAAMDYTQFVRDGLAGEGLRMLCCALDLSESGSDSALRERAIAALSAKRDPNKTLRGLARDYLDASDLKDVCRRLDLPTTGRTAALLERVVATLSPSNGSAEEARPQKTRSTPPCQPTRPGRIDEKVVSALSEEFDALLSTTPGSKAEKLAWIASRVTGFDYAPSWSFQNAWLSLVDIIGLSAAAQVVFDLVLERPTPRVREVLDAAVRGSPVEHRRDDPVIIAQLFGTSGRPSELGALLLASPALSTAPRAMKPAPTLPLEVAKGFQASRSISTEFGSILPPVCAADVTGTDHFLQLFGVELEGPKTPKEVRRLEGPHVYFVHTVEQQRYAEGYSRIAYIGFTESPRTRFADHAQVEDGDALFVLPLTKYLRVLKESFDDWRDLEKRQKRSIHESAERLFIFLFMRVMGSMPARNSRRDLPTKESAIAGVLLLECQRRRLAARGRMEDLSDVIRRLEVIRRLDLEGG